MKNYKALVLNPTGKPGGNHETRLYQLIAAGRIKIEQGSSHNIKIEHDDWCALIAGKKHCNCHPTINGIGWEE